MMTALLLLVTTGAVPCPFTLKILIATYDRPAEFARLWDSLEANHQISCPVEIIIHQDRPEAPNVPSHAWRTQRAMLHGLSSSKHTDSVKTHVQTHHQGLKSTITKLWDPLPPNNHNEFALFLEDDLLLSEAALAFVEKMLLTFYVHQDADKLNYGFALYSPKHNDAIEQMIPDELMSNRTHPFGFQMPCSWGAVYTVEAWRVLQNAHIGDKEMGDTQFYIPYSMTNLWPGISSWKKVLLRSMVENGAYLLYPRGAMSKPQMSLGEHLSASQLQSFSQHYEVQVFDWPSFHNDFLVVPQLASLEHEVQRRASLQAHGGVAFTSQKHLDLLSYFDYAHRPIPQRSSLISLKIKTDVEGYARGYNMILHAAKATRTKTLHTLISAYRALPGLQHLVVAMSRHQAQISAAHELVDAHNNNDRIVFIHLQDTEAESMRAVLHAASAKLPATTDCLVYATSHVLWPGQDVQNAVRVWKEVGYASGFTSVRQLHIKLQWDAVAQSQALVPRYANAGFALPALLVFSRLDAQAVWNIVPPELQSPAFLSLDWLIFQFALKHKYMHSFCSTNATMTQLQDKLPRLLHNFSRPQLTELVGKLWNGPWRPSFSIVAQPCCFVSDHGKLTWNHDKASK